MADSSGLLGLSTALEGLRQELQQVYEQSRDEPIRFHLNNVELTLQAVAKRDTKGGAKIRWWLVEAGADVTAGKETTQTLVLTLTPEVFEGSKKIANPVFK